MCPPTRRVQASARVTPRAARHCRDSRAALHNTWPTVIMTTHSAGQPGPGSPQTAPAAAQSASAADPPLHCRTVILPHAAAGLAQEKKIALLPAITSGKTGIPGCCRTRPKHKIPTKAHKGLVAQSHKTRGQGRGRTADLPLFRRTLIPTELPDLDPGLAPGRSGTPLTRAVLTGFEPATSTLTGWRALRAALQDHAALADASSAPNGIRTRAAALKGRCPRPLDDGGSTATAAVARGARRRGPTQHRGRTARTAKQ